MVKNRRANAVLFGFDFQRNAAIILMLERIKELRSVRLEGNEEDIELTLENGKKILAQAKAVEKSSSDFSHVRENLKKALISLSEGAQRVDAQELMINILKRDFSDNQIIIASIFQYDFKSLNVIEIKNRLIEN